MADAADLFGSLPVFAAKLKHDDPRIQGTRALFEAIAAEPRLTATAVQTVGAKKWDGFVLAIVHG